jgi:integrase
VAEILKNSALSDAFQADPELMARLREFVQDKDAFSPNTWSQLKSVMAVCWRWSQIHHRSFFPMLSSDLRDYLSWLQSSGRASTTIATHASLISMLHCHAGVVSPNSSPVIYRTIKKINRIAVVSGERTGQAIPFRLDDLHRIDDCWAGTTRLQQLRDLAFLHIAYSTLLRISELARIRVKDLSRAEDGRFILDVSYTKTIVQTGGLTKALSTLSSLRVNEWLEMSGLRNEPESYLFCRVHRSNKPIFSEIQELSRPSIEAIFKNAWHVAGSGIVIKANKNRYMCWSGHSARVGAAQDMTRQGYPIAQIMQEGTWKKPETLMRYIRNVDAHSGAMIDLMEKSSDTRNKAGNSESGFYNFGS